MSFNVAGKSLQEMPFILSLSSADNNPTPVESILLIIIFCTSRVHAYCDSSYCFPCVSKFSSEQKMYCTSLNWFLQLLHDFQHFFSTSKLSFIAGSYHCQSDIEHLYHAPNHNSIKLQSLIKLLLNYSVSFCDNGQNHNLQY